MSGVRVSKYHAVFPRGYRARWWEVALFAPSIRIKRLRSFSFGLRHSRFRTALVARYFHRQLALLGEGDSRFFDAIAPDAELSLFFETYKGPKGWHQGVTNWLESVNALNLEVVEFANADSTHVMLSVNAEGRGASSGVASEILTYFVISIEDGMAVQGLFTPDKGKALEAAGLSEDDAHSSSS